MRSLRAWVGGLGASASLVAGAAVVIALLTGGLAFHAWTGGPPSDGSIDATEIAGQGAARRPAAARGPATAPGSPARGDGASVPVQRPPRRHGERRRRARDGSGLPARPAAPTSGGGRSSPDAAGSASEGGTATPVQPPGPSGAGSGGGSGGAGGAASGTPPLPSLPAPPAPPAPTLPSTPTVPSLPGQALQDASAAIQGTIDDVTTTAAEALRPVLPPVADRVQVPGLS